MHERYLEHYGVPGMKWGRRKSSGQILIGGPTNQGTNKPGGSSNSNSSSGSKQNSSNGSKKKSKPYVDAKWREVNDDGSSSKSSSTPPKQKPKTETPPSKPKASEIDLKGAQTGLKSGKKVAEAGANMLAKERKDRNTKSLKAEAKEMTDEDLKKVINRLATEQRYVELMGKEGVKEAKSNLETTLETLTTVATIADTALGVYGAIQDVRRMK